MLQIEGLRVAYGDTVAVTDFDLEVGPGEIVALLGPSGCGKTSVLRAVAGLAPMGGGQVRLDGRDITAVPPHKRGLGLMFQDYALFPHRDVRSNVAFGPRMLGWTRSAIGERVDEVLTLVGLQGLAGRAISSLSGGEQQRVALARALAPAPTLLLLDEPLGSLDRTLRERLAVEVRELFTRLGLTAVTVTHDQSEAFTMADRVAVMRDGRIVQAGTPAEVWRAPRDGFVARFLGFGSRHPAPVEGGGVASPWGSIPAPGRSDGEEVLVVIRPDGLRLGRQGARGTVGTPVFRGEHWLVPVALEDGWAVEVVARGPSAPKPGASVRVVLDQRAVLVVDR